MNQLNFRQLELYFPNQITFVDYTSFIEFCYYIDKLRDLRSNKLINVSILLNVDFFKKEVSVSKFKQEVFKTDKIFSFSRSVFFNNWIETVFEKEHITEDDSDLEFYNGVYFSNLCLKTFNFFEKHGTKEGEFVDDYHKIDLLYSRKGIRHKYIRRFEKEKAFRKKFFWKDENIILNSYLFKFLINSYLYSRIFTSTFLKIHKINFSKFNYIRANKILDSSSTYKFDNRLSNAGFYGDFILSNSNYSYFLYYNNFKHSLRLEWIWTFIPTAILVAILYPSLLLLYSYDKPYITKPYLTIKAIGNQWYWSYEYSDNSVLLDYSGNDNSELDVSKKVPSNITINPIKFDSYMLNESDLEFGQLRLLEVDRRLVLPVGVCIRIVTTSTDVIHSWAVPSLGIKIDSIPGRLNQFWLVINKPGVFYGQCSELCGVNHAFMPIAIEGVSLDQYYDYLYNYYSKSDD